MLIANATESTLDPYVKGKVALWHVTYYLTCSGGLVLRPSFTHWHFTAMWFLLYWVMLFLHGVRLFRASGMICTLRERYDSRMQALKSSPHSPHAAVSAGGTERGTAVRTAMPHSVCECAVRRSAAHGTTIYLGAALK